MCMNIGKKKAGTFFGRIWTGLAEMPLAPVKDAALNWNAGYAISLQ